MKPDEEIKTLAEEMDQDAENINAHDFVGCHESLATLACDTIGKQAALKLFRKLGEERGLHGLNDICGCRSRNNSFRAYLEGINSKTI
jgi:hypothetical protein